MLKNKISFAGIIDEKLWHEDITTNPYFGTLSLVIIALAGALLGGGQLLNSWFGWDVAINSISMSGIVSAIICANVGESVMAANKVKVAVYRSILFVGAAFAIFVISYLAAIIAFIFAVAWIVITIIGMVYSLIQKSRSEEEKDELQALPQSDAAEEE